MKTLDTFRDSFENMQVRYGGAITVVSAEQSVERISADAVKNLEIEQGFYDVSMPARELDPIVGRVVLSMDRKNNRYCPAVITKKGDNLQMSRLNQAFDPRVGLSDGIRFGLGLKNDTSQATFGSHVAAGGFEAGHFAPVLLGAKDQTVRTQIKQRGDEATHKVGNEVGGVPEKMLKTGLLSGVNLESITLDTSNPHPIPLFWHPALESEDGLAVAHYEGSVNLMLGAAAHALGDRAVDTVGELVNDAVRR